MIWKQQQKDMKMKTRACLYKVLFSTLFLSVTFLSSAQVYTTQSDGDWNNPAIWLRDGIATLIPPSSANSTSITVNHVVTIGAASVIIDQARFSAGSSVTVNSGFTLSVNNGPGGITTPDLAVRGTLTLNGGVLSNTGTAANLIAFDTANVINNGSITFSSGTLRLSGTTSLTGTPNTGTVFSNVTVPASSTVSVAFGFNSNGTMLVAGALTTNGTVIAAGNITISGSGSSFTANANYSSAGILTATNPGTFTAGASANGTITGNLAGTGTFTSNALVTFSGVTNLSGGGVKTFNNVTITGSVSASATVNLVVNGDFINNGTINFSAGTVTLAGASKILSGTPVQTSFFDLTIAQNASITSSINFTMGDDLTIGGSLTTNLPFTANGDLIVSGAIPVGTLNANATFTVGALMSVSGSATAAAGFDAQAALTVTGVGASLTSNGSLFSVGGTLTVSASGTLQANAGFDAQGALTVTGLGSTFTANTVAFTVAGALTVNTSGNFTANVNGTLSGNLAGTSTYTSTALTTFDGTTTISGAGVKTLNNVIVTGSVVGTGSLLINGDLTNNAGTINPTGGTWTLSGTSKLLNGTTPTLTSFFALTIPQNMSRTSSIPFTAKSTLTIGGSLITNAIFNANGALTVGSAVPIGSLTANASFNAVGTVTVGGSLTSNSGFTASGAFTVSATTGSFTANNNPFSIGGNVTVNGFFTANAGADLTLTDNAGNNFIVASTGTFTSLATVIFDGTTTMTQAGPRTFTNIRVNSGRFLYGSNNFTVTGNINNNGGTIDLSAGGVLTIDGIVQLGGSPAPVLTRLNTVTIGSSRSLLMLTDVTINGNLTIDGAIAANDGTTVTFVGLTMSGSGVGIKAFDNIHVSTGTFIPNVDYSITGDIQVTGTMQAGNATTFLTGTTNITGNASFNNLVITGSLLSAPGTTTILHNLTNNGTCSLNAGTVQFSTSSTVQQVISGSQDITLNILVVSNVGTAVDLTNEIDASRFIYLRDSLGFFEINSVFDADGLSNNKSFVLLSTNDDPANDATVGVISAGSGITSGGATPSSVTVQRYMSTEGGSNNPDFDNGRIYRYISVPVNNPSVSQLQDDFYVTGSFPGADNGSTPGCTGCSANPSLYFYNSSTAAYVAFAGGNLLRGVGYAAFIRNDLTPPQGGTPNMPIVIDYTGPINAGAVLNNTISSNPAVWNLVGNPYPSPIAWNNAGTGTTNIAAGISVRDNSSPGGTLIPLTTGDKIATGQAFWVRANTNGAAQLTFNEADKTSILNTRFLRMSEEIKDELSVRVVRQDGIYDETIIRVNRASDGSMDTYDIPKKNGVSDLNNDYIDITSVSTDGKSMLLNTLPQVVCGQQIQLNFEDQLENGTTDLTASQFSLSINTSGSLEALKWYLHDSHTGSVTNLATTPVYNFTVDGTAGSAAKTRFYLTIESSAIDVSKQVQAGSLVCDGNSIELAVMNTQSHMTYGLDVNGVYYPNLMKGNGGTRSIELGSEVLTTGNNTIKVKVNSGCTEEFLTTTVNVVKEELPQVTSTLGVVLCKTGSAVLSASGAPAGATYNWYASELGGSVLATGQEFNTPILNDSAVYYVSAQTSSGCKGPRVPVLAAIQDIASNLVLSKSENIVCAGGALVLSAATSQSGSFNWYDTEASETVLFTGNDFTTPALSASKSYFVSFVNQSGCESARVEMVAEVSVFTPAIITQSLQEKICVGGSHTFTASGAGTGAVYEWFDAIDSTTPIIQSVVFETPALTETQTYYVRAKNELGCVTPMVTVQASVNTSDPSLGITQSTYQVCQNENFNIIPGGAPAGSTYRWYLNSNDIVAGKEGASATWEDVNYSSVYYMSAVDLNGCEGSRKEIVLDVVNFVDAQIDSVSDGELVSNYVEGNQWYLDGVMLEGENNQIIAANRAGVYSVRVTVNGMCETWASRVNLTAVVTGTDEEVFSKGVSVYPNPVQHDIQIRVLKDFDQNVTLIDSQGRKLGNIVLKESGEYKSGSFDMSGLPKGFFYMRAMKLNKPVFIKIIKR
jgi:hypothetical protein